MGMMLPNELIWIMEKLGFEWPDIDEDELRRGAEMVRAFRDDLEAKIQAMDRKVNGELADALRGEAGTAYVNAWNVNRSQNLQKLTDLLGPAPTGIELAADAVLALKIKVIADVTITLAQLIPLLAAGPFGAGGAALLIIAKKKLLDIAMETALEAVLAQVLPMVVEPLANELPGVVMAALDSPIVESVGGDPDRFYADLQALEAAEGDMQQHAADVESLTERLMADLAGLNISGD